MKCPTCGQELGKFWSDENSMKEHGECFECSLWRERLTLKMVDKSLLQISGVVVISLNIGDLSFLIMLISIGNGRK